MNTSIIQSYGNESSTVSQPHYSFPGVRFKPAAARLSPTPIANELTLKSLNPTLKPGQAETFLELGQFCKLSNSLDATQWWAPPLAVTTTLPENLGPFLETAEY